MSSKELQILIGGLLIGAGMTLALTFLGNKLSDTKSSQTIYLMKYEVTYINGDKETIDATIPQWGLRKPSSGISSRSNCLTLNNGHRRYSVACGVRRFKILETETYQQ